MRHITVTPANRDEEIDELINDTEPGTCENCGEDTTVGGNAVRAFCSPECAEEYDNED